MFNNQCSTQHIDVSKKVNVTKVKNVRYYLMIFYKQNFSWAMMSPNAQQMYVHSWELFVITVGKPINNFCEHGVEIWNKYVKFYKSGPSFMAKQSLSYFYIVRNISHFLSNHN